MIKVTVKTLILILIVSLVLPLFACGDMVMPSPWGDGTETISAPAETSTGKPDASEAGSPESAQPSESPEESAQTPAEKPYSTVSIRDAKVGDVIVFGSYEQDGNQANGKEPFEWLVLTGDDSSLLVLSLYGIERMQFHSSLTKVTWETSAVRAWLNGDFLSAAFSAEEKEKIENTMVTAEKDPKYPNSPAGNDTQDKLFLLSAMEAELYLPESSSRICAPTDAVAASAPSGIYPHIRQAWYSGSDYLCSWWLRSPGTFKDLYVSYVDHSGNISGGGQVYLTGTDLCVRPAMWISVS